MRLIIENKRCTTCFIMIMIAVVLDEIQVAYKG